MAAILVASSLALSGRQLIADPLEPLVLLQIQDQLQSGIDVGHELGRDSPSPLREILFVEGHDLRDVGHGVLREAAAPGRKKDVARSVEEPCVRGEDHAENRPQSAAIEGIGLNDEDGAAKSGLGSARFLEIGPPHLTAFYYHSAELTLRAWADRNTGSIPLGSSAKTSLSLPVTSSSRCLAKYSATAVA